MAKKLANLTHAERQFFNALQTPAGRNMLKQFQEREQNVRIQKAEYLSQKKALEGKKSNIINKAMVNKTFIRKVGEVLTIVETDVEGKVKSVKLLNQDIDLVGSKNQHLAKQLEAIDPISLALHKDGLFRQKLSQSELREIYRSKFEFENNKMEYMDLALESVKSPEASESFKQYVHEQSTEGQKELNSKLSALDTLIAEVSAELGEEGAIMPSFEAIAQAKSILNPPKPFNETVQHNDSAPMNVSPAPNSFNGY
jgi:hypothetical protein